MRSLKNQLLDFNELMINRDITSSTRVSIYCSNAKKLLLHNNHFWKNNKSAVDEIGAIIEAGVHC